MGRDIIMGGIFILIFAAGMYCGATIKENRTAQAQATAVKNAIAYHDPSPLDCKDNQIIEAVGKLADNGIHAKGYTLILEMDNQEGQ